MIIQPQNAERLIKLLVYLGGVASTAAGALFASRIRVYEDSRKAHLEDLKQKVLIPLRDGLEEHFRPLVFGLEPLIFVEAAAPTEFPENAKSTESQIERGDVLQGAFPSARVFGPIDSALLEDARKRHFRGQLMRADKFISDWLAFVPQYHVWVRQMAEELPRKSGLPPFPNRTPSGRRPAPYVMHYRLATFVYKRLFRFSAPQLATENMNDGLNWRLDGEGATLACGPEERISALVAETDKLLESERGTAEMLRNKAGHLQKIFQELTSELNYAIASRRLRKQCDLVPFF